MADQKKRKEIKQYSKLKRETFNYRMDIGTLMAICVKYDMMNLKKVFWIEIEVCVHLITTS